MEFKLEKGQKYNLSRYEEGMEGEFIGVLRKSCGKHHHNRLVFKTGEDSYWTADADTKIMEDGTICIVFDVYDFKKTLAELLNPPPRPKETAEII